MQQPQATLQGWAQPNVFIELPTLSPAFLSADDAARFAHELIGDHRDVQYGGAILKNNLEQFFATRPVTGHGALFRPERVMSTNQSGTFKHPPGYTCVAFYHSHADIYEQVQTLYEGWPSESLFARVNLFSPIDIYTMMLMQPFVAVSYLSGLNGSLIKYECSGSDEEKHFTQLLGNARERSVETIDSPRKAALILIKLGTLSVIQSSECWDKKVGALDGSFTPWTPQSLLDIERVIIQRPAFGPIVSTEALALQYVRSRTDQTPDEHYGVILRHNERDEFVVSEPITTHMDFSLNRVFLKSREGVPVLLPGYQLHALYGCDGEYRDPTLIPAEQASLYKNFLHPQSLENGIVVAQLLGRPAQRQALPLFIATRDGAMLKYVSRYSADEKTLFAKLSEAEGGGMELIRNLLADVEPTLSFIHRVAHCGELSVVHSSELWSQVGRVQVDWQPYRGFVRRNLGPTFVTADDAARHAHELIAGRVDAVYGGLIYQDLNHRYFATEPLAVHTEIFPPQQVIPPEMAALAPPGASVVAAYQSHRVQPLQLWRPASEEQLIRNVFEPHELYMAIQDRVEIASRYLSTRDGALLKLTPRGSAEEQAFMASLAPPAEHPEQVRKNTLQMQLRANALMPSEYVARISKACGLHVVVGSALWGNPGQVTPKWKPCEVRAGIYEVKVQPPLSPIFAQAQDAMRYAHERMGERKYRQFGVILKKTDRDEFVVTHPVVAGRLGMQLGRIFPHPFGLLGYSLPRGFSFHAVYIAAPSVAKDQVPGSVYADFIAPVDLSQSAVLMSTVRDQIPGTSVYPPLFISTRDGALLSYRTLSLGKLLDLEGPFSSQSSMLTGLLNGKISPTEYVRHIAGIGQLEVVLKSSNWATLGRVTEQWRPDAFDAQPVAPLPNVVALGPEFVHIDDAALYFHRRLARPHVAETLGVIFRRDYYGRFVVQEPLTNGVYATAQEQVLINPDLEHSSGRMRPQPVLAPQSTPWGLCFAHRPEPPILVRSRIGQWIDHSFWPMDICYVTKGLVGLGFTMNIAYLSGNDGALLKYVRGSSRELGVLCQALGGVDYDEVRRLNRQWIDSGLDNESQHTARLLKAGELVVVHTSSNWPRTGWVTPDWKNQQPVTRMPVLPWAPSPATRDRDEL
ncbi:DUF4329 domain-containing protein [Pseudomonas fragi]|uniref:DUF4329 domain-containing protein n=1 Tax=Pseudomonas fragi TaxID=296 RepID=UPI0028EF29A0|nr:DUF4329 domain-containing protein [Pseudomonas fragi]